MNREGVSTANMTPFEFEKTKSRQQTIELEQVKEVIKKKEEEIISRISESRKVSGNVSALEGQQADNSREIEPQSEKKQPLSNFVTLGVMSEVEQWLVENVPAMSKVGPGYVNPSFKSEYLTLHLHRV